MRLPELPHKLFHIGQCNVHAPAEPPTDHKVTMTAEGPIFYFYPCKPVFTDAPSPDSRRQEHASDGTHKQADNVFPSLDTISGTTPEREGWSQTAQGTKQISTPAPGRR
jgi:hypothetical protein